MTMESDAKEAAILKMLNWWGSQASRLTDQQIGNYLEAVEDMSLEAVEQSCKELRAGLVQRNNEFMPQPVELAINTRRYDRLVADHDARKQLDRIMHTGIVVMDFGHGNVNMVGLTQDEQDKLIKLKGMLPDGRNAAGLDLQEKKAALLSLTDGRAKMRKIS